MEKEKEKNFRLKLIILIGLLVGNLIIPASYMLERVHYTKWENDLNIDGLQKDIVASYKLALEQKALKEAEAPPDTLQPTVLPENEKQSKEPVDTILAAKMDDWRKKLLGGSKLAAEFQKIDDSDSDFRLYAVKREFSIMKAVTNHLLVKKEDRDILVTTVETARKDWVITPSEAEIIMNTIRELNKNAKDKWDFLPI